MSDDIARSLTDAARRKILEACDGGDLLLLVTPPAANCRTINSRCSRSSLKHCCARHAEKFSQ